MAESNRLSGIVQQSYVKSAEGSVITARDELEELQYLDIFPIEVSKYYNIFAFILSVICYGAFLKI